MLLAGSLVRLMRTPVLFIPQQWKIRISSGALTPVGSTATCAAVQCRHLSSSSKSESEVSKAESAKMSSEPTIFAKILNKEIPAEFVYEDELCAAIRDVNPISPVHILIIPRNPITALSSALDKDTELLGHLLQVAKRVAEKEKLKDGYRIVINNGRHGAQSVYHLHVHLLGGRQFEWPPG